MFDPAWELFDEKIFTWLAPVEPQLTLYRHLSHVR